jgi:hypothetical protein
MVIRVSILSLVALALVTLAACRPASPSCGRGRCPDGACINVVSTHAATQELSLDYWCAVPCDEKRHCLGQMCLQSPVNWNLMVCAGDQLELKYTAIEGKPYASGETLLSLDITTADGGMVNCPAGKICSAGWFRSGSAFPNVIARTTDGPKVAYTGMPGEGYPASGTAVDGDKTVPLGPLLPTGLPIVIRVNGTNDYQEDSQ